jgi:hypothetical protein
LRAHPEVKEIVEQWPEERIRGELDGVLEAWGALDLTTAIAWRWYPRLRTSVGRAVFADMMIELNPLLLARHPDQVRAVLVHEAAHLVVQRLHGRQNPHGRVWKHYMRQAGESTSATHSLDVRGLRRKRASRPRRSKLPKLLRALRRRK